MKNIHAKILIGTILVNFLICQWTVRCAVALKFTLFCLNKFFGTLFRVYVCKPLLCNYHKIHSTFWKPSLWPEATVAVLNLAGGLGGLNSNWNGVHRLKKQMLDTFLLVEYSDMVWLYRLPTPVGRRGIISSVKWFLPVVATATHRGSGGKGVGTLRHKLGKLQV